jgi:hypothetical protein
MQKILWFGFLGALGGLVGAAVGEVLWHLPATNADGKAATVGRTLFSNELNDRLEKAGAKTGQVQVSLAWNNTSDLDLHCIDPNNEEIFFNHRRSASGGEMDIDMNFRPPYSDHPVENIYWPAGKAPLGRYQVVVTYFANHDANDPTEFVCGWIVGDQKTEMRGKISAGEAPIKAGEFTVAVPRQTFTRQGHWTAALWTALLAGGVSLVLVMGQNRYLGRAVLSFRQTLFVLAGAFAAGMFSGGLADMLFETLMRQAWLASCGRWIGWGVLGGMLGAGMSFVVPNLPRLRAGFAGAIGGLAGAAAFECFAWMLGNLSARWAGAAVLGFSLGSMVAVVEALCREAWLEVFFGPKERKLFSLGKQPVTIGSGPDCTVYVGRVPALALHYVLEDGRIRCTRAGAAPAIVSPGHEEQLGTVRVVVQGHLRPSEPRTTPSKRAAPRGRPSGRLSPGGPPPDLWLRLSAITRVRLTLGTQLGVKDLPGVSPYKNDGPVAEVVSNPKDPSLLGLKNLSRSIWQIAVSQDAARSIEPGQSVSLCVGMKIDFGELRGEITG